MTTILPPPGDPNTVYVMDLSGYVFRAYHALPPLSNSKGEPTHATLGVANMLNRMVKDQRPVYLAVAMDSKSENSIRKEMYPEYKATRPTAPPDLAQQMRRCRELAEAYALPILHAERYEADDLIAACVREARGHGLTTVICSADKDLMQLVADDVMMWDAMRNKVYGLAEVREKWGVGAEKVCDLLALMGDTSDNVPGVTGIGEKTAAKLITEFGSLDGVYAHVGELKGKLRENLVRDEPNARISYKLVCLTADIPVEMSLEQLRYGGWDAARLKALLRELEFQKLADAIEVKPVVVTPPPAPEVPVAAVGPAPSVSAPMAAQLTLDIGGSVRSTPPLAVEIAVVPAPSTRVFQAIFTREELQNAIAAARSAGIVAIETGATSPDATRGTLVGISLAWNRDAGVYIPFGHRVIGDPAQLDRAAVLSAIGPLLTDPNVKKVSHDIKHVDAVMRREGIVVDPFFFDTMIASYLIDPERHSHRLDEIANAEMHYAMMTYDSITKRERGKQIAFDEVDIATATRFAAEQTQIALELGQILSPRIDEDPPLAKLMREVELPLAMVLSRMEARGVLVDIAMLRKLSGELALDLERLEKELHALAGKEFNVNSPRQLESILFDELKLRVIKRTKTSRSTDHEVLEELAEEHPIAAKILEQRQLFKLKGTYLDALPSLVNPATGRIHTSYNQAVAATGRLSSNNPNLQNIPIRSDTGGKIREAFVAPPGHVILSADYSQIELRVLAHLSNDPILLDAFRKNEDIHTRTAMEIYSLPAADITRTMRAQAKTTNFAVLYGQGENALARALGIPRKEAGKFIERYFKTFPNLTKFLEETVQRGRAEESVRTLLGRRRNLPTISSENRGLRSQAERIAKNTPIQGTAADIIKLAMVAIARRLEAMKLGTQMILTVHDELVFEVPESEREVAARTVRETMESAISLNVPLLVEVGIGDNWGKAH